MCSTFLSFQMQQPRVVLLWRSFCRQAGNFIKKRFQHRCFPKSFAKFLRTLLFIKNICARPFLSFGIFEVKASSDAFRIQTNIYKGASCGFSLQLLAGKSLSEEGDIHILTNEQFKHLVYLTKTF